MKSQITNILPIFAALIYLNRVLIITPDSLVLYYGFFIILIFLQLSNSLNIVVSLNFILLLLSAIVSIIFNDIPSFFSPLDRFISFLIVLILFSPLIRSEAFDYFRINFLNSAIILIIILILISFIIMVMEIIPLTYPYNGIIVHSMILGPLAAFSLLACTYLILYKKVNLYVAYALAGISLIMLLVSSSRGALLSLIVALLFLFFKYNQIQKSRFITRGLLIPFLIVMAYPIWGNYMEGVQSKMDGNLKTGSILSSRISIWEERIIEFNSSPIYGVGFASITREYIKDTEKSQIELGSSYLGILSMTGILGAVSFIIILFKLGIQILLYKDPSTFLISSYLMFLIIHLSFEGYIFGSGNALMLMFWLLIGISSIFLAPNKNNRTNTNGYFFTSEHS